MSYTGMTPWLQQRRRAEVVQAVIFAYGGVKERDLDVEFLKPVRPSRPLPTSPEGVTIGWYCRGESIDECRKEFGENLWFICRSCPN